MCGSREQVFEDFIDELDEMIDEEEEPEDERLTLEEVFGKPATDGVVLLVASPEVVPAS